MEQIEFDFDDLSPDEQAVYLRAAQRLLNDSVESEEGESACPGCGASSTEAHQSWCPMLAVDPDSNND